MLQSPCKQIDDCASLHRLFDKPGEKKASEVLHNTSIQRSFFGNWLECSVWKLKLETINLWLNVQLLSFNWVRKPSPALHLLQCHSSYVLIKMAGGANVFYHVYICKMEKPPHGAFLDVFLFV